MVKEHVLLALCWAHYLLLVFESHWECTPQISHSVGNCDLGKLIRHCAWPDQRIWSFQVDRPIHSPYSGQSGRSWPLVVPSWFAQQLLSLSLLLTHRSSQAWSWWECASLIIWRCWIICPRALAYVSSTLLSTTERRHEPWGSRNQWSAACH